jgi:phytol kinase
MDVLLSFILQNTPSLRILILGGPISLLWAYGCLFFAGYLKKEKGLRTGYTRKIFHFLIFTSVACIHKMWGLPIVCLFGGMTSLVIVYALVRNSGHILYEAMAREKDAPYQTYYIIVPYFTTLIGGIVTNLFFGPTSVVGYLVGGLADAVGEPVGTRFGKHTYVVPSFSKVKTMRSYEGSLAVWFVSLAVLTVGVALIPGLQLTFHSMMVIFILSLICTLLEAVSPHGWDNAVMQIIPTFLVFTFLQ